MADNLILQDRMGLRLSTNEIDGVHVLRVKLQVGADGSAQDVSGDTPVPVAISGSPLTDLSDRAARLVGVVYGSQGAQLKQTATNNNLQAELAVGGALIDPRDVSDRAARLVGVVYGSQGAQLKQTATNNNLQAELAVGGTLIDPRAVRALTSSDVVTTAQGAAAAASGAWPTKLSDGANTAGVTTISGAPTSYALKVDAAAWVGSNAPTVGQKAMSSSIPVVIANDQSALAAPTLTKGTQGGTGFTVQNLKDAGRSRIVIAFEGTAPATADTLLTLVKKTDGSAAGGATSIAVAVNKRLRITCVTFSLRAGAAAAAFGTLTLRENPSGTVVLASPTWLRIDLGNTENTVGAARSQVVPIPDGIEFSGSNQIGVSLAAQATTNVASIELIGFEY